MNFEIYDKIIDIQKNRLIEEFKKKYKNYNIDDYIEALVNKILESDIDISKINDIQKVTKIPLVLHGSSGISYQMRKKIASNTNVAKFNIGTELRMIAGNSLRDCINDNIKIFDRLQLLKPTILKIKNQAKKVIKNIGENNG